MDVTLEWVRDNYDANKNRLIDADEVTKAINDLYSGSISREQRDAVKGAYDNNTLLPEYGFHTLSTNAVSTFNIPTGATLEVDGVEVI